MPSTPGVDSEDHRRLCLSNVGKISLIISRGNDCILALWGNVSTRNNLIARKHAKRLGKVNAEKVNAENTYDASQKTPPGPEGRQERPSSPPSVDETERHPSSPPR